MEKFKNDSYASHGFSKIELFVILLAIGLVVFIAIPKIKGVFLKIKLNSAINSAYSYKESVSNYYVSQVLVDSQFKLDGYYIISDGNLITDTDTYNILMSGNIPTEGYLDYDNNILRDGCIVVEEYAVIVSNGDVISATKGTCGVSTLDTEIDVALEL